MCNPPSIKNPPSFDNQKLHVLEQRAMKLIRVLVVDDSSFVRQILTKGLEADPQIEVVGSAPDVYVARDMILSKQPDVLTLDIEMPRMNGVKFLRRLMPQYPVPVVIVSSFTKRGAAVTFDALAAGAIDFVLKPSANQPSGIPAMIEEMVEKVKMAALVDVSHRKAPLTTNRSELLTARFAKSSQQVVAIGASTGGIEALRLVVSQFPSNMPGVVMVQHLLPGFTKIFSERLNEECAMTVQEATSGDPILPGKILIAPGGQHMQVRLSAGGYGVECAEGEKVNGHCPSVDVLFRSVAKTVGAKGVGVMLTGMGDDGAEAMVAMRQQGVRTLAQDQKTSAVFGMPNEAYKRGGAEKLVALEEIAPSIIRLLEGGVS